MKKISTKERILQKSLELFNNQGVEKVTTSLIAKELGISLGNLHYHFPNRDALIRALIDVFLADMEKLMIRLRQVDFSNFLVYMFRIQIETFRKIEHYRFIFVDRLVIKRRMDYLEIIFRQMVSERKQEFDLIMQEMKTRGLLRADIGQQALDGFFVQVVIGNNSWLSYTDLFPYESEAFVYFSVKSIWSWRVYLTASDEAVQQAIGEALAGVN